MTTQTHTPIAVESMEGMPFVKCSCRDDYKPQSAVWLREHWQGDEASGIAALRAVVAKQRDEARADERRFTADEVIAMANETSDSLGNLYRLDFIDRVRHEAGQ